MTFRKHAFVLVFAGFAGLSLAADGSTRSQENFQETIAYLTLRVAEADVTFIRNSKDYTPVEAAKHLTSKYQYFKEEIRTPEDFIRLIATKSIMSGKPYLVRTRDDKIIPCSEWLHGILHEYRHLQGD
jgi:hypothetical protein